MRKRIVLQKKKIHPTEKSQLHPRNKHRERYDFKLLVESLPELAQYVILNEYQDESIDFFNPDAVKILNKALLKKYYSIEHWDIPANYLCPPIPGRADYIHYIADVLASSLPNKKHIKCLDIGTGANLVYPMIGNREYGWSFVCSDIDPISIQSAQQIIDANPPLQGNIELRLQTDKNHIFQGIIQPKERFDITICNPPFHASAEEAQAGTMRKLKNLTHKKPTKPTLNFGGQNNELWCEGGEKEFLQKLILESKKFAHSSHWFSSLVSKESNLIGIYKTLKKLAATEVKTITMGQGNKTSRIVVWTFL